MPLSRGRKKVKEKTSEEKNHNWNPTFKHLKN